MSRLRSTRGRVALVAAGLLVAGLIAVLSRQGASDTKTPFNPHAASGRLAIGVVNTGSPSDREVTRGLKLWVNQLGQTGGVPYAFGNVAAIEVDEQRSAPTPQAAAAAARKLLATNRVTALVGPTDPDELAAVAEVAVKSRALLFSARPRPVQSRFGNALTYVPRGQPERLGASLDIVDRIVKGKPGRSAKARGRVLILYKRGPWGLRALKGADEARMRGYKVKSVAVPGTSSLDALLRSAGKVDFTAAFAPPREALSWFKAGGRDRSPWTIVADETTAIEPGLGKLKVAVEVPWSNAQNFGDGLFGPGGFARAYDVAYGGTPTTDAVAGASIGLIVRTMVILARSTDPTRLLKARDAVPILTPLGPIVFQRGQPRKVPAVVVLLARAASTPLLPNAKGVALLQKSVPPKTPPAAPAPPVAATTTPAPVTPSPTGTTTAPAGR